MIIVTMFLTIQIAFSKDIDTVIENTCKDYNTYCKVVYYDSDIPRAYTNQSHNIYISSKMKSMLSDNELLAVAYHEIGHIVLNHFKEHFDFTWNNYPLEYNSYKEFRHLQELQADTFSTLTQLNTQGTAYLPNALQTIVPIQVQRVETYTHPSTYNRIQMMNNIINYRYDWRIDNK